MLKLNMNNFLQQELNKLKETNLLREPKIIENTDGRIITINGKEYLNFCSNNYLGLTHHPKVVQVAIEATKKFGTGAGASRLITGTTILHKQLEEKLAKLKGKEAAIVFPTGYMANLGTISSLLDEKDTVIIDRLNHASIIDACKLSKAKLQVYPHKDMKALEKILQKSDKYQKRLIVTDHVFSMDGDMAPVDEISKLAEKHDATVMIDTAHATGVIQGSRAKGQVDIIMGTMSKTLGSLGGFVCGSKELIDYLRNKARSFIYTTALPPANCAAAIAAIDVIENEPEIRQRLLDNLKIGGWETPIVPIVLGSAEKTLEVSKKLFDQGIFVSAIRPPTVPKEQSRLRITITASHTKEDIECLVSSLQALIPAAERQ